MRNLLRKIIGRMANLTPNVVYFAKGWPAKINRRMIEIEASKGGEKPPLSMAAIAMSCAMHEYLKVGDEAEIKLTGVSYGGRKYGDFIVTAKRTA